MIALRYSETQDPNAFICLTQPPLEAQEDVENIRNLQESGSLEGFVDMEVSDEVLETIGEQSSSRSNDLHLSQTSAGCQLCRLQVAVQVVCRLCRLQVAVGAR